MDALIFNLGKRTLGCELSAVGEVLRIGYITPVPLSPPILLGATHVQGQILPVIDLAPLFSEEVRPPRLGDVSFRISAKPYHVVLFVHQISGVANLPELDREHRGELLVGRSLLEEQPVDVVDLAAILEKTARESERIDRLEIGMPSLRGDDE